MIRTTALLLALLFASCSAPPAPPPVGGTTAPDKVSITPATASEIEQLMGRRAQALSRKDLEAFQATFDGSRAALRRCESEAFDVATRLGSNPAGPKVARVEPYLDQYARAYVGSDAEGYRRLYFRQVGGKWLLSDPTESELGGGRTKTIDGINYDYYGIDDDVIDVYAKAGSATQKFVQEHARDVSSSGLGFRIFPTRSAAGPMGGCRTLGSYLPNSPEFVRIYGLALVFEPGLTAMGELTLGTMKHEALHRLQDQLVPNSTSRLDWWMVEGWPDYLDEARPLSAKQRALCTTQTPTLKQLQDGVLATPETPPELTGQYYAFANTMVEYLYATHGRDAYFKLLEAYKATVDQRLTYPRALGITSDQFYEGWKAWSKQRFC